MVPKLIIDTNILVSALSSRSTYHWIIEMILQGKVTMYVTDEIMLEYEEILQLKYSPTVASYFLAALKELPNVIFVQIYFRWNLLKDQDDNKFVDSYIASDSAYLVTNDRGFKILKNVDFPKIEVVSIEEFQKICQE